jgi:hypothetical protein
MAAEPARMTSMITTIEPVVAVLLFLAFVVVAVYDQWRLRA